MKELFKLLFKKIDDMDDIEVDKAYFIFEKLISITCFLGFHVTVNDDGDIFCLFCNRDMKQEYNKKHNFIIGWIQARAYELRDIYHDLHDPYASY